VLDRQVPERAELARDLVTPDVARDPRWQHRIVIELVAEAGRFLEERHAEPYRGNVTS
jgi:hypothetical protein